MLALARCGRRRGRSQVLVGAAIELRHAGPEGAALALVGASVCRSSSRSPIGAARNKGVGVGRAAGAAMSPLRKDDGATRDAPYTPGMGPGKWRPHPKHVPAESRRSPIRTRRAGMRPRTCRAGGTSRRSPCSRPSQYWLPGPPALTSPTYARDFIEVKSCRREVSTARTADQTRSPASGSKVRQPGTGSPGRGQRARRLMLPDTARLLALMTWRCGFLHRRLQDPLRVRLLATRHGHPRGRQRR